METRATPLGRDPAGAKPSRRKQLALVASLGLLGLAVLAAILAASLPPAEQTFRLGDGAELTLEGVTYGKTRFHLIEAGGLTERLLRLLPLWILEKGGFSKVSIPCDDPGALVYWVRWPKDADSNHDLLLRDEHGCELPLAASLNVTTPDGAWLRGHVTRVLPYGRSPLTLRIAERSPDSPDSGAFVDIPVWNPAPASRALEAQALPAVWRSDELEVTFLEFTTGHSDSSQEPLAAGERQWTRFLFNAACPDRRGCAWQVQGVEILDADGDAIPTFSSSSSLREYRLEATPCFEEAWRVRVAFVPGEVTTLPPGEVWKVEGLEAGRPGEPGFQRSLSLQGADVQLIVYNKGKIVVEATVTHTFPRPIPRLRCTLDVDGAQEADFDELERQGADRDCLLLQLPSAAGPEEARPHIGSPTRPRGRFHGSTIAGNHGITVTVLALRCRTIETPRPVVELHPDPAA